MSMRLGDLKHHMLGPRQVVGEVEQRKKLKGNTGASVREGTRRPLEIYV